MTISAGYPNHKCSALRVPLRLFEFRYQFMFSGKLIPESCQL